MTTEFLLALAVAATPMPSGAQTAQGAPSVQGAPTPVAAAPAPAREESSAQDLLPVAALSPAARAERREYLTNMEGLFVTAVVNGARKVQADNPGMALALEKPRARGFVLDGYGVFFDVEVPELTGSVEVTLAQVQRELARRADDSLGAGARRTSSGLQALDAADPNDLYREAVLSTVIAAMLDYSKNLNVPQSEWLTVALRGSEQQGNLGDARTVTLRIKGSDLSDYLSSRLSKAEAARRVEKREF